MSLSDSDRELLYTEFSKLTQAGFPIGRAVRALRDHDLPSRQSRVIIALDRALGSGQDLATALEEALGNQAPDLDVALIRAGQEVGKLPESLAQLAEYYGRRHRIRRTVRTQLIYPAILLHLGVILPSLPKIIAGPSLQPLLTAFATLVVLWIVLFAGWLVVGRLDRAAANGPAADAFLNRIPLYGKMRRNAALSRFSDVFRFFLVAGKTVSSSLRAAGRASGSGTLMTTAEQAARAIESERRILSEAIAGRPGIPRPLTQGIRTAEVSGKLDIEMERWSKLYAGATEEAARNFGAWVPRIIYFIIVLVVAWKIIKMTTDLYSPMLEMLE